MRPVILHGHIFKNAGTTLDWSLGRVFGSCFLDHRQDREMLDEGMRHVERLLRDNESLSALSSHHMPVVRTNLPGVTLLPLYLVRHPLERIVSVYEFERKQEADTPGARAAGSKSFQEYVRWRMDPSVAPVVRNYQTLYLAGAHSLARQREVGMTQLLDAVDTLRGYALVGVVERYDESMVCFEEALREYFPGIDLACIPQNVAAVSRGAEGATSAPGARTLRQLDDELRSTVIDHNGYDLSVYTMANELLDARIRGIADFAGKLARFRQRCRELYVH